MEPKPKDDEPLLLKRGGCYYTNVQYAMSSGAYKSNWLHGASEKLGSIGFRSFLSLRTRSNMEPPWTS